MATKIIHKKSSVAASVPASGDIEAGELAVNLADKKLYSKQTDGTVIAVGVSDYNDLENLPADFTPAAHTHVKADITDFNEDDYVSVTGDVMSGNLSFGDNDKAIFGAGSDLQIYHDGTHSYLLENGTGNLRINTDNQVQIRKHNNEAIAYFNADGAVQLYYDNSAKFATTSTGIYVTGTVTADGLNLDGNIQGDSGQNMQVSAGAGAGDKLDLRAGDDVRIWVDGATAHKISANFANNGDVSLYEDTGTTAKFFWDASTERLGLNSTSPTSTLTVNGQADFQASGTTVLSVEGGATNAIIGAKNSRKLKLQTAATTRLNIDDNGDLSLYEDTGTTAKFFWDASAERLGIRTTAPNVALDVNAGSSAGEYFYGGSNNRRQLKIKSFDTASLDAGHDFNASSTNGVLSFSTGSTERMRIDSSGNVGIGTSSPSNASLDVVSNATASFQARASTAGVNDGDTTVVVSRGVNSTGGKWSNAVYRGYSHAWSYGSNAGSNEAMRIDSSGNVGIGLSSNIDRKLHVEVDNDYAAKFGGTAGGDFAIEIGQTGASGSAGFNATGTGGSMKFSISGSEAARIDTSGNLLVGKTSNDNTTAGAVLRSTGQISAVRNGNAAGIFNRLTSDGDIVEFRKDGTTVGSIGAYLGDSYVGTGAAGLRFYDAGPAITPHNTTTNAGTDGTIDLGTSAGRFKDLYLSEKVNLTDAALEAEAGTTSSTTETTIATFPKADFDAAKFVVMANDGTDTFCCEILVVHDGTAASATEYAQVSSDDSFQPFYEVDISGNDVRLRATAQNTTSTTYKVMKTLL